MELVLDIENSISWVQDPKDKNLRKDNSPYNSNNKLVVVGTSSDTEDLYWFHHTKASFDVSKSKKELQDKLDSTTLLIGHNLKYDLAWLRECGFTYDGPVWDTQIAEYILSRGQKLPLSLEATAERYKLDVLKGSFMKDHLKEMVNVDEMPLDGLETYLRDDLRVTGRVYAKQKELLQGDKKRVLALMKAINLCNKFLPYLVDMERAGIYVDQRELTQIKLGYEQELELVEAKLQEMVHTLMGDRPYNLASGDDLSAVMYSRRPRDKKKWKELFNIGSELRGSVKKQKMTKIFKEQAFSRILTNEMSVEQQTKARKCRSCNGVGHTFKKKKDGTNYARPNTCKACDGVGVEYLPTGKVAGLRIRPLNENASVAGFSCDGSVIDYYLERKLPDSTREFLESLRRKSKLSTWVNTFCEQLQKFNHNGFIHPSFNQTITATGRLSCSNPNMQNQPKRDKSFTLRKAFKSRFKDGRLYEADFGQLEFRIAAYLSQCPEAIRMIKEGLDVHTLTRDYYYGEFELKPSIIWEKGDPKEDRQKAKAETFGPLYGKITDWTKQFYILFPGIAKWHEDLMVEAATNKETVTPSGRIYAWPFAERYVDRKGNILTRGHTQIKNYSVQGFATGDLVLLVIMDVMDYLRKHNAKSKLCIQVHDSALVDAHPSEFQLVEDAFKYGFDRVYESAKEMFGIDINVPLAFDLDWGVNWYGDKA